MQQAAFAGAKAAQDAALDEADVAAITKEKADFTAKVKSIEGVGGEACCREPFQKWQGDRSHTCT